MKAIDLILELGRLDLEAEVQLEIRIAVESSAVRTGEVPNVVERAMVQGVRQGTEPGTVVVYG